MCDIYTIAGDDGEKGTTSGAVKRDGEISLFTIRGVLTACLGHYKCHNTC